jgi:hypothetical protein
MDAGSDRGEAGGKATCISQEVGPWLGHLEEGSRSVAHSGFPRANGSTAQVSSHTAARFPTFPFFLSFFSFLFFSLFNVSYQSNSTLK